MTKLPNPLARAGRNRRASPTQTREKRRNGAAWAPILMFARGRAGAKGDVWSGILVCGHPVTGHPRATHLVHTLVHGPRSARKSSIRSMTRQFVLEAGGHNDANHDGCAQGSRGGAERAPKSKNPNTVRLRLQYTCTIYPPNAPQMHPPKNAKILILKKMPLFSPPHTSDERP